MVAGANQFRWSDKLKIGVKVRQPFVVGAHLYFDRFSHCWIRNADAWGDRTCNAIDGRLALNECCKRGLVRAGLPTTLLAGCRLRRSARGEVGYMGLVVPSS